MEESFFTVVGCMDGRIQEAVFEFGRKHFQALFPDTITDAGIVKEIAFNPLPEYFEHLKKELMVSVVNHGSKGILVNGHQDCAGNPTDDETHKKDVLRAAEFISTLVEDKIPVAAVFVSLRNHEWMVEEITA